MSKRLTYLPELDGLRGFAILLVVFYHAKLAGFGGGFIGVDIFFVLSGYLVTFGLYQELVSTKTINLGEFFQRRIKRLLPVFFFVILITLAIGYFVLIPIAGEQQALGRSAIASSLFLSNLYFIFNTGGYFDEPTELQPLLHTWSLSVEAQFYLIWPFIIGFIYFLSRKNTSLFPKNLTIALGLLSIASLFVSLYFTYKQASVAFFLMPSRMWEFGTGGLLVLLPVQKFNANLGNFISSLSLLLLVTTGIFYNDRINFPGFYAIIPVIATAAIIIICNTKQTNAVKNLLSSKILVTLGTLSYSFYLWHWPLLTIYRVHNLGESDTSHNLIICAISFFLSYLTYHWIEKPIRTGSNTLMATPKNTYIFGGCMILIALTFATSLGMWSKYSLGLPQNSSISQALINLKKVKIPKCLPSSMMEDEPISLNSCKFPEHGKDTSSLIWGDSHAAHLVPGVSESADRYKSSVTIRYMPECPPIQDFAASHLSNEKGNQCKYFNHEVLKEVIKPHDLRLTSIILSARWNAYLNSSNLNQFERGLNKTISTLIGENLTVILFAPVPNFAHSAPPCIARRSIKDCAISIIDAESKRKDVMKVFYKIKHQFPEIHLIDPFSTICKEDFCYPQKNNILLYSDSHHLSEQGSLMMSSLFNSSLFFQDHR